LYPSKAHSWGQSIRSFHHHLRFGVHWLALGHATLVKTTAIFLAARLLVYDLGKLMLPLNMVDKSTSPLQSPLGRFFVLWQSSQTTST
jgi:hypothetical protein